MFPLHIVLQGGFFMRKFGDLFLTMVAMGFTSVLLLIGTGIATYFFKWQADTVLLLMTFIYIVTGFTGGIVHRSVCRENEKYNELFQKIGWGLFVGSMYLVLLLVLSVTAFQNDTFDIGRIFLIWFLIAGSGAIGELVVRKTESR